MAEGIQIDIVSPENQVLSEMVRSVTVPGTEGYFTVMADHAPLMTTLRPGFVTVTPEAGEPTIYFVRGGFADVSPEGLTILAEKASTLAEFSTEELQEQIKLAQEELERAQTHEERTYAQEVVDALLNLMVEAGQLDGAHVH